MNRHNSTIAYLLIGFLLGLVLLVVAMLLFRLTGTATVATVPTTNPPTSTSTQSGNIPPEKVVKLLTATPSPLGDFQPVVDQAENYLATGYPVEVKPLVEPWLLRLDIPAHKAIAYRLLGQAEEQLGRNRIAASYYEQMVALDRTVEHLYLLAMAYDMGGELAKAYPVYQELLTRPETIEDRAYLEEHLVWLASACYCTPEP